MQRLWKVLWMGFLAMSLWGCAPLGSSVIVSSQGTRPPVQEDQYPAPGGPVVSTSSGNSATAYPLPVIKGTAVPVPNSTGTPGGPGEMGEITVILEQNGQTIHLKQGQTFLLKLGEIYQWNIQIDNQDVIQPVPTFAAIKGAQGLFSASQPGTATLSADGDPLCRQSKPACMMPSIHFSVMIVVKP